MSKKWYAVQAFSGYEKIVHRTLLERIDWRFIWGYPSPS